jgi:hypothetical protein
MVAPDPGNDAHRRSVSDGHEAHYDAWTAVGDTLSGPVKWCDPVAGYSGSGEQQAVRAVPAGSSPRSRRMPTRTPRRFMTPQWPKPPGASPDAV